MWALATVLMLCAVIVGPASAATSVPTPPPIDPRLLIIGDSVILGAHPWVAAVPTRARRKADSMA